MYDFSNAARPQSDLIPDKTQAPIRIAVKAGDYGSPENAFSITDKGFYMLNLECTVLEGEHAKRKFWPRYFFGAQDGVDLTEGQQKAVAITHSALRAILEAARGFAPTDESPDAVAARRMSSIFELDGLEIWVEIGVEVDKKGQYGDKNVIRKVIPVKAAPRAAAPAARPAAAPAFAKSGAPTIAPSSAGKPAWAK